MIGKLDSVKCFEHPYADQEAGYISASKILACTVYDLLKNGVQKAIEIKESFNKKTQKGIFREEDAIECRGFMY